MREVPRGRGPHLRRAATGLVALLALAAIVQSWSHFTAGSVPRSNMARRVADLADVDDPASGARLALAEADAASPEFTDVRVAEADAAPESRPSPSAQQTSSEEVSVDVEPTPELSMAQAPPEMETSPVDPAETNIGSAVEDPEPQGDGLPGILTGTSGDGGQGPLSGIGGGLGPLIGIIGGIALGGGSGPGPLVVLGGGSGLEGSFPGIQLPGPIATGPRRGEFEGPGPLGGNPTSGAPTIRIPGTVPADPSGIIGSGGRGFVPEAPDLGRTNDQAFGSGATSLMSGSANGGAPVTGAAVARIVEEAARSFGTRRDRSSFSRPEARQLAGPTATAASPRTTPTRSTSRAAQVRPSTPNRTTRMVRPSAAQRATGGSAASATRRAIQTRASTAARPTAARQIQTRARPTQTRTRPTQTRARPTQTRVRPAQTRVQPSRRSQQ